MNEHDDAYVDAMLMVNMQANTRSVTADFDGTYHAILGRPSLTKFMAVPHYSYLVLKMQTDKGVLTVRGNVYTAYTCEEESFKVTEAIDLSIRMAETVAQATQVPPGQL